MTDRYDHKNIESKWQQLWDTEHTFVVPEKPRGEHTYVLDMFPYPSAAGLHVGHPLAYIATDIYSRYLRLKNSVVLHPMGWDAFGLPAENFAIKSGVHPRETTLKAIDNYRKQLKMLGFSYDWSREVNTADPSYYKWTQWLFLKLYEKGLAYRKEAPVNWCPSCQTVLANEQVVPLRQGSLRGDSVEPGHTELDRGVGGVCERCGTKVEQRNMKQWFFKTTAYAERLLTELEGLDWPKPIVDMQKNWIGKSEGASVKFYLTQVPGQKDKKHFVEIFTTRLDTIFGATFVVVSPELAKKWIDVGWQVTDEVKNYVEKALTGRELERMERAAKEKTGVDTGVKAINPATNEEIPVWVADFVLGSYGTGAIMAVPAHDERDWEFAKKFKLPITRVVLSKKKIALLIHGTGGRGDKYPWYQKLRVDLESAGFNVVAPDLPNPDNPLLSDWLKALDIFKTQITEDSVVIGHSLGGPTAMHFVASLPHKIAKLILVAPTSKWIDWEEYARKNPAEPIQSIKNVSMSELQLEKVQSNSEQIYCIFSTNDNLIPLETERYFRELLGASTIMLENRGHFSDRSRADMLPEVKELILSSVEIEPGVLINSGKFTGLSSAEAIRTIAKKIGAELKTQYKLHDWLISRQRYWGAPIPVIYCEKCGEVPVPEKDLPVVLPDDVDFRPTGESPLARSKTFHNVACPKCGKPARRESDTLDTFVDSSWYFLRYCDPQNTKSAFDPKKVAAWCPVNFYVGGAEHAVLHLMYARFITKVLQDMGYLKFPEPFLKLRNQGLILGEDGQKMSKSKGNVINPDEIVEKYGADTLRLYEMFMGPLEDAKPWNTSSIIGIRRFLERVWNLCTSEGIVSSEQKQVAGTLARVTKKVTEDIEGFKFNTAIAALMELVNELSGAEFTQEAREVARKTLLELLYPFAPHLTAELWQQCKFSGQVWEQDWPTYDKDALQQETVTIAVQVNGKLRGTVEVSPEAAEAEVVAAARAGTAVAKYLTSEPKKIVYVPGKLVSFVVG